jgi:hypothetical protein
MLDGVKGVHYIHLKHHPIDVATSEKNKCHKTIDCPTHQVIKCFAHYN